MTCGIPGTPRRRNGNPSYTEPPRLRILLTNGRFPVALDLARQLYWAGHYVFVVDPMQYHVCKFSIAVKSSKQVPAPHDDAQGYITGVKDMATRWRVDLIIPIHEEIFFLANSGEPEILNRLFAPPFELLVRLHNKWEFHKLMKRCGMDVPEAQLCRNMDDVKNLPVSRYKDGMALKPCFGRASTGVHHLKPGDPLPEGLDIGEHNWHIAQEWIKGNRYCSYSVVRKGKVIATGLYPVLETIDGSSSVFFQQQYHHSIYAYIERLVAQLDPIDGQLAFDFIQVGERIVVMECNPRSTSGLHLWSNTPFLARALTDSLPHNIELPITPPRTKLGRPSRAQVAAGMLMWEHKNATPKVYLRHMARLMGTHDVTWKGRDMMPSLIQPFLLTTYFSMCRETGLQLPELFQMQLLWEPKWDENNPEGCQLGSIRRLMKEADDRDEKRSGQECYARSSSDATLYDKEKASPSREAEEYERLRARIKELELENQRLRNTGHALNEEAVR